MFGLKDYFQGVTHKASGFGGAYDGKCPFENDAIATGLVAATRVATTIGWRPVEGIIPGDMVLTFDGGMQPVARITRSVLWSSPSNCPEHMWPLEVPAGALGNKDTITLLPEQGIMVESDAAEEFLGDPFALLPAGALSGIRGIRHVAPQTEMVVYTLHFATEQVVFTGSGILLHCASDAQACLVEGSNTTPLYDVLPMDQAAALAGHLEQEYATDTAGCAAAA